MSFLDSLRRHRAAIADRWVDVLLAGQPEVSADFFRCEPDPFRNPVGSTLRREVPVLLDGLLDGGEPDRFRAALEAIVRLQAVSGLPAGQALAGLLALSRVAREVVENAGEAVAAEGLLEFHARVDELALHACDAYVACRERIAELRVRETRAALFTLLRQAGMLASAEGDGVKGGVQT